MCCKLSDEALSSISWIALAVEVSGILPPFIAPKSQKDNQRSRRQPYGAVIRLNVLLRIFGDRLVKDAKVYTM